MIEETLGGKKVYKLSEEECKRLLKAVEEAIVNNFLKSNNGLLLL